MNNTINEPLPRLSTRLLLSMYGKESEDLNKLWHTRMVQLKRLEQANDTRSTFLLTDFTSNTMKAIEFNAIKSDYKSFIDEVNCVADSATQSNAAKTMYNIITKRDSLEVSYSDACSYFGKIHVKQWNSLVQLAQSLERAYNSKDRVEKLSEKEFGSDLKYHIPFYEIPEQFDVIDSNELFQKSCEEEKNSSISINDKVMIDKGPVRVVDSDTTWLAKKCSHHVATTGMLLDGKLLTEEICNFYSQTKGDEDLLQMKLFDLIGETGFELMLEIMQNLHRLKNITSKTINEYFTKPASNGESDGLMSDNYENLTENQRRKREQKLLKRAMKESEESYKTEEKKSADWLEQMGFSADYLLQERALGLQKNRDPHEVLEKWTEDLAPEGTLEYHEKKGLPADTERKVGPGFEEVNIPAAERPVIPDNEVLIEINNLEPWAQKAFAGTKRLNRIQSKVFETAYNSSENMLVCAPTGRILALIVLQPNYFFLIFVL